MSVGLYRAAVAMAGHERHLDAIAANLANLGTVGFKRSSSASHEFAVRRETGEVRGLQLHLETDFSQGNLQRTGHELDLALFGDGFFVVEGPEGETYTRDGSFHLTEEGVLVNDDGHAVAWRQRSGTIDATGLPVRVDVDGFVRQGTQEIGQLKVVDFMDKAKLYQGTGGVWVAPVGAKEATATAQVHQYSLEESNASGIEEIVAMIGVQRAFETSAHLTRSIQESYARLTRAQF